MTLPEQPLSQTKRRWYQFRLRTMLILITLVSVGLGIYKPITLHFKAVELSNYPRRGHANRPHPDELLFNCYGLEKTAFFEVGKLRIAFLERRQPIQTDTMGFIPIAGEAPQKKTYYTPDRDEYFSYSYAGGQTECVAFKFRFQCNKRTIQINDQVFNIATPTVILVDVNDKILYTYSH